MPEALDWTPDRRRTLRVDVPPRAAVDVQQADGDVPVTLRQISERGLVVECSDPLGPGTVYDVTLVVAGAPPLPLHGTIVYTRTSLALGQGAHVRYVSAVALDPLGAAEAAQLRALVERVGIAGTHTASASAAGDQES